MNARPPMTLRRLRTVAASYGADLDRWPADEGAAARDLLEISHPARAILEEAAVTDGWLVSARASEDAQLWPAGGREAALARLRAGVAGRIAEADGHNASWRAAPGTAFGASGTAALMPTLGTLTAFGIAGVAGLGIGWLQGAMATSHAAGPIVLLLSGPIQGLAW